MISKSRGFSSPIEGGNFFSGPSFGIRNRLGRLCWTIVYRLLFRPSPRSLHAWRRTLLRLFGAKLGTKVRVAATADIWAPWNLHAEDFAVIGDGTIVYCMALVSIGHHAVVSQRAHLCCGSHDYDSPNFQLVASPIVIGPRAWVCAEAYVGPGVTVSEGTIVGARCVMTHSPGEAWGVYAGNPARLLKNRKPV